MDNQIILGDCLQVLPTLEENSVDSVITDPPYGISLMAKDWDRGVPGIRFWKEALRVAKPGACLLAFGGDRTHHRLMVAIEDAGWEIRSCLYWVYFSGFPKSADVSKLIDKAAGAERKVDDARKWDGWGTALKPAAEIIVLARKPLSEKTLAANVLKWGTGGLNIEGCRIPTDEDLRVSTSATFRIRARSKYEKSPPSGRWPAQIIHDGSDEVTGLFPQSGFGRGQAGITTSSSRFFKSCPPDRLLFFPKPSQKDRHDGLEEFPLIRVSGGGGLSGKFGSLRGPSRNPHPTVKPTSLLRYLCRLVTPKGGLTLDPFFGSGSTGKAAAQEGFKFIGIEINPDYVKTAEKRVLVRAERKMRGPGWSIRVHQ